MKLGNTLYVTDRKEWRAWLAKNHGTEKEIWLVYFLKSSKKPRIPYNDAVEEALCFGWIDSTVKKIKEGVNAQRFSARKENSPLSEMNKERVRRLVRQGKMTPAGMKKVKKFLGENFTIPEDILLALKKDKTTWKNFKGFPGFYKHIRIGWIEGARNRPAVFVTRLRYFLKMTKSNRRFGMVR